MSPEIEQSKIDNLLNHFADAPAYWKQLKEEHSVLSEEDGDSKLVHLKRVYGFIEGMEVLESQLEYAETLDSMSENMLGPDIKKQMLHNCMMIDKLEPQKEDPEKFELFQKVSLQLDLMVGMYKTTMRNQDEISRLGKELKIANGDMTKLGIFASRNYSHEERVQLLMQSWDSSNKARRAKLLKGLGFPKGFTVPKNEIN